MRQLQVDLAGRAYHVVVGRGLFARLGEVGAVSGQLKGRRVFVVTDRTVHTLWGEVFEQGLESAGATVAGRQVLEPGEDHKDVGALRFVWDGLVGAGIERGDCLAALGGGVVGDIGGFAAATYLRGIDFVQFPTTVLAVADSSVGGKTAVDHPKGKNLLGAFHQPRGVVADLDVLRTLPTREVFSGLAEVIKAALVGDAGLFDRLEALGPDLVADGDTLEEVLAGAVAVKARIVGLDERETGPRALLNLGHTLGHALEVAAGYGVMTHGEAVAAGIGFAACLSRHLGLLADRDEARISGLLRAWGYPVKIPGSLSEKILCGLRFDKKSSGGAPRWVLLRGIGAAEWGQRVPPETVETLLRGLRESP